MAIVLRNATARVGANLDRTIADDSAYEEYRTLDIGRCQVDEKCTYPRRWVASKYAIVVQNDTKLLCHESGFAFIVQRKVEFGGFAWGTG